MRFTRRATLLGAASLAACSKTQTPPTPKPSEGKIAVTGGSVAWRRIGDGPKTPLLCLHGGPGVASDYLDPLGGLGDERPVYFYDQLGCGRSDRPMDPSLWTVERFVAELATVREELGLKELHLLGQSWGTMLATEYLLKHGEDGVRSAVFAGPAISVKRYAADARSFIPELTPDAQAAIAKAETTGDFTAPGYEAAINEFNAKHLIRAGTPETLPLAEKALAGMNQQIYALMNGPSEFNIVGSIKDFDRTADLGKLNIPILFLSGEFDTATPAAARDYAAAAKHGEVVVIPGAGHLTTIDAPGATNNAVRAFLNKVET